MNQVRTDITSSQLLHKLFTMQSIYKPNSIFTSLGGGGLKFKFWLS